MIRLLKLSTLILTLSVCCFCESNAQTLYSEQEVIQAALNSHPSVKAAQSALHSKKQNEKSSLSLPGPNIYTQSPSGTFYTIGINQNIDFPTLYTNQKKVYKAESVLAESHVLNTQQEITWQARILYNTSKYETTKLLYLYRQDSMYQTLFEIATKQFEEGEIDFLSKTFATIQYESIHQKFLQQQTRTDIALQDVMMFCQLPEEFDVLPYAKSELLEMLMIDTLVQGQNAILAIAKNETEIAEKKINLEKSKAMPAFQIGYLNQVYKNSPMQYRFQAGITIPLWWWQYAGRIKSAKSNAEAIQHEEEAIQMNYQSDLNKAKMDVSATYNQLSYYLQNGLAQFDLMESASNKFYSAGETDLTMHLRTMNDILNFRFNYIDAARDYINAIDNFKYITGSNQ